MYERAGGSQAGLEDAVEPGIDLKGIVSAGQGGETSGGRDHLTFEVDTTSQGSEHLTPFNVTMRKPSGDLA